MSPSGSGTGGRRRPEQLALGTGGPKDPSLFGSLADLRKELTPLELVVAREANREIHERRFHDRLSATVQLVGLRPT